MPNHLKQPIMTALLLLSMGAIPAIAGGYLGLYLENDSVGYTDRYNTHASRLDYQWPAERVPDRFHRFARRITGVNSTELALGVFLSQNIYTPADITEADPPPDMRPYAGWLRGGVQMTLTQGASWADTVSLSLGVIGPASGAKHLQRELHRFNGANMPQGWDTQLPNELALDARYERRWKVEGRGPKLLEWALIPYGGGNAGTVFGLLRTGLEVRLGRHLPEDFSAFVTRSARARAAAPAPRWAAHLFASAEGRWVWHNVLLDGSLWRDSRSADKRCLVGELSLGVQGAYRDQFVVTYAYVMRSMEFEKQSEPQIFGMLSGGWWF